MLWVGILFLVVAGAHAQSLEPVRIVASDASSIVLDFTLMGLRETIGADGLPALTFDGASIGHSHDHSYDAELGSSATSSSVHLPHLTVPLGLPPDVTPRATLITSDTERIPLSEFPFLAGATQVRAEELVSASVAGYVRDQYIARVTIRPVELVGGALEVTTRCRIRVTFGGVPAAPAFARRPMPRSESFEGLYRGLLANYEQARKWRKGRIRPRTAPSAAQASTGRVRLRIDETALYRVTPTDLAAAGVDTADIDPTTFRMTYRGDEVGVDVLGAEDGAFDGSDRVIFLGERLGHSRFTTHNAYLLSWGGGQGVRPAVKDGTLSGIDVQMPTAYRGADYYEVDRMHADLAQVVDERADHYFWTSFTGGTADRREWEKTITVKAPTEANNIPRSARLRIAFQGGRAASFPHRMRVQLNGRQVLDTTWAGQKQHFEDVGFDQSAIGTNMNFTLTNLDQNATGSNTGGKLPEERVDVYLDWFELDYWREFRHKARGVLVSSHLYPALKAGPVRYEITGYPSGGISVYELGDDGIIGKFANVQTVAGGDGRQKVRFQDVHSVPTRYLVAATSDIRRPIDIQLAPRSGLDNPSIQANYVIITHSTFLDAAQQLADYRGSEGHQVKVVDMESIYNDFSHGVFSPFAIQNFLRSAYVVWETPPEYVLLIGDAHYDYKNGEIRQYSEIGVIREHYPNFVPTIHSWGGNASGETAMDQRFVTIEGDDPLPDMFIGRLPVQRASEARDIVRKIIAYEAKPEIGLWQTRMAQVADDQTTNPGDRVFQDSRDSLIATVIPPAYDVQKIYLKEIGTGAATKQRIKKAFTDGALVIEYAGHGGRDIWADEDILRLPDTVRLPNGTRQPLLVATTCQLNKFDKPERFGERSMGEQFLLGQGRGAIAVIGATRKTFARCNAIFDTFLFPEITSSDTTEIGRVLTQAKIMDWVTNRSVICLPGLEQYVLFGDPATRLARPQLLADVAVAPLAANPGQQVSLLQGFLYDPLADPPAKAETFDGAMTVTIKYPNNLDANPRNDLRPTVRGGTVFGGEYGDLQFTVPGGVEPGQAAVRIFAHSGDITGIGGARFSVRQSRINSLSHRSQGEFLIVEAELANPNGVIGVSKVELSWRNNRDFKIVNIPMQHLGALKYRNAEPIPLPGLGRRIMYTLIITDRNGSVVESDERTFQMPLGPDLAILELGRTRIPEMSYGYEQDIDQWAFRVVVVNRGDLQPDVPAEVIIAEGNADVDGNWRLDDDASVLSRAFVQLDDWTPGLPATGEFQRATVILPVDPPLAAGVHEITVWIDPATVSEPDDDDILGKIGESKEFNNRTRKPFAINNFTLGDAPTNAYSLDRTLEMLVPGGAAEPTTLSISLDRLPDEDRFGEPASPYTTVPYLRLTSAAETVFRLELQSGETELDLPAHLEINFDFAKLRQQAVAELETVLTGAARLTLEKRLANEALARVGIYEWLDEEESWRRLDSTIKAGEDGEPLESLHVTPPAPGAGSQHELKFQELSIDQTTGPSGEWVVFFVSPTQYEVLFLPEGANSYQRLAVLGTLDEPYADASVALRRLIVKNGNPLALGTEGSPPATLGETLGFTTAPSEEGVVTVTRTWGSNEGDGTAEVSLRASVTLENAPYGEWVLMVTDNQRYEIRTGGGTPVINASGAPLRGSVNGPDLILANEGLVTRVLEGSRAFQFGDTFRVRVGRVMTAEVDTTRMGTYTLLRDIDATPPTVQVFVNDLAPQSGEVIPPRPTMTLLLSDPNGIDAGSFRFERQKLGETDMQEVDPSTYTLNPRPVDQMSVAHRPILFVGTYLMRVHVKDLAGVSAESPQGPFEEFIFLVEENPDLEPPTFTLSYENGVIEDGQMLTETPQQLTLHLQDSHALAMEELFITVGPVGGPSEDIVPVEITFDRLAPSTATATWPADLTNGEYEIQARVADTSTNVGFLGAAEDTPFRVIIDEPVHFEGLVLNAPNPFSPFDPVTRGTFFTYNLSQPAEEVSIRVYTASGRLARVLEDASGSRGYNETYWDGRDDDGLLLANGVYFYKVRTESVYLDADRTEERLGKLVILR